MKTQVGGRSQSCDNQVNEHQVNSKGKGPEAAPSIGYWKNRGLIMELSRGESDSKGGSRGRQGQITEGLVGLGKKI